MRITKERQALLAEALEKQLWLDGGAMTAADQAFLRAMLDDFEDYEKEQIVLREQAMTARLAASSAKRDLDKLAKDAKKTKSLERSTISMLRDKLVQAEAEIQQLKAKIKGMKQYYADGYRSASL